VHDEACDQVPWNILDLWGARINWMFSVSIFWTTFNVSMNDEVFNHTTVNVHQYDWHLLLVKFVIIWKLKPSNCASPQLECKCLCEFVCNKFMMQ
jgi:hypothetical protein